MDDRLADQHVGKDVGPERAGEELAAMAADRAAGLGRHREVLAADRDPAIGEVLPDLVGDIEVGAQSERVRGRGEGKSRAGREQETLAHESFPSRYETDRRARRASRIAMGGLRRVSASGAGRKVRTSSGKTQQILNARTGGYVTSPPFTNAGYPLL